MISGTIKAEINVKSTTVQKICLNLNECLERKCMAGFRCAQSRLHTKANDRFSECYECLPISKDSGEKYQNFQHDSPGDTTTIRRTTEKDDFTTNLIIIIVVSILGFLVPVIIIALICICIWRYEKSHPSAFDFTYLSAAAPPLLVVPQQQSPTGFPPQPPPPGQPTTNITPQPPSPGQPTTTYTQPPQSSGQLSPSSAATLTHKSSLVH